MDGEHTGVEHTGVEQIMHKGKILAVISRARLLQHLQEENKPLTFVTPPEFPFQVGMHQRKQGETIAGHFHLPFQELKDFPVQEFFYVISGKLHVDLFDDRENDQKVAEIIIRQGDTITLNTGHGFHFLEDTELVELKQGPYRGRDQEKRFIHGITGEAA